MLDGAAVPATRLDLAETQAGERAAVGMFGGDFREPLLDSQRGERVGGRFEPGEGGDVLFGGAVDGTVLQAAGMTAMHGHRRIVSMTVVAFRFNATAMETNRPVPASRATL